MKPFNDSSAHQAAPTTNSGISSCNDRGYEAAVFVYILPCNNATLLSYFNSNLKVFNPYIQIFRDGRSLFSSSAHAAFGGANGGRDWFFQVLFVVSSFVILNVFALSTSSKQTLNKYWKHKSYVILVFL